MGISPAESGSPEKEQQAAGVGILLQIMMLVLSFVLGHVLRRHKFYYLPEASASLLIGLIVGGLANISNTETSIRSFISFPIIKPFFSNFGAIVTFAILGTFIASVVTGVLVRICNSYLGGRMYLMYGLPFVECLMFGALISATDPVTVLSIFQELGTDTNLYALVFGESVLNDAMAISLYRTMSIVRKHASSAQNFFMVIFRFLETFVGSMSAVMKTSCLSRYMLAEGLGLSGIVSILFTAIVMKHYSYSNLSENSQQFVSDFFHLISSLAETFTAANVFSCAYLVNLIRPVHRQIPLKHQKALWYSGLRGAMAFALALQSVHDLPEGRGQIIFTATTAIVVLSWFVAMLKGMFLFGSTVNLSLNVVIDTYPSSNCLYFPEMSQVLLIGGSTGTMLEALHVVGDSHDGHLGESFDVNNGYVAPSFKEDGTSGNGIKMKLKEFHKRTSSFTALDKNYLTPFFTSQNEDDEEGGEALLDERISSSKRGGFLGQ
ncbi:hypothetical protein CXB51_002163 [Gossypium anomalum]|uniref:Cation/H+ exchanger transmembrane domain-containing protein n=1 Tax=Gossypium anomalum TaxID=47600 RepID=A0A8J5Z8S7_9ROSI|nr:hypothetical protein CXB51_002163 [Gossypium anomalum]